MGRFLEDEKVEQAKIKAKASYFSEAARADGVYKQKPRPFCLPQDYADENLYAEIRKPIKEYFARHEIKWHDGKAGSPSNHLCDSQVCCANFLFPFYDKPAALAALLRPIYPDIHGMLPVEDGGHVAFEWIGATNYLGEKVFRSGKRTRGANFTSADAAVMFSRADGRKQIVLIEWKYTESYSSTWLKYASNGTDRSKIYAGLYQAEDCPLDKDRLPDFDSLFYEPFYQLMRQQFLAHEMEKASELGADIVSLLHISPAHNHDFMRVTSPDLKEIGHSPTSIWKKLVSDPSRFSAEYTENLFGKFPISDFPELAAWWAYIATRYRWVID